LISDEFEKNILFRKKIVVLQSIYKPQLK